MQRRKVKRGEYVKQGDVIGWVGHTGSTEGRHVCYRFWKHGRQVDPFKEKLPAAEPLKKSLRPKFLDSYKSFRRAIKSIKKLDTKNKQSHLVKQILSKIKNMPLKNINPTTTKAWKKLYAHFSEVKDIHLKIILKKSNEKRRVFNNF